MQNCRFSIEQMVPLRTSTLVEKKKTQTRRHAQRMGQAYRGTVKLATLQKGLCVSKGP